ncbi:hypothetical protein EON64_19845, partial [archaeon]
MDSDNEADIFVGYDGHTKRRFPRYEKTPYIQRMSCEIKVSLGETLFPYTAVDKFFDTGFIYQSRDPQRGINSAAIWQECMEMLETLAVQSQKKYHVSSDTYTHTFHVPVEGHMQHNEDPREVMQSTWLCWRGKYIDPAYMYTAHYNGYGLCTHLTRLCALSDKPSAEVLKERGEVLVEKPFMYARKRRQRGNGVLQRQGGGVRVGGKHQPYSCLMDIAAHNLFYDIELGSVQYVHSIGMKGGYPRCQSQFPTTEDLLAL